MFIIPSRDLQHLANAFACIFTQSTEQKVTGIPGTVGGRDREQFRAIGRGAYASVRARA